MSKQFSLGQRVAIVVVPRLTALLMALIGVTLRFEVITEEGAVPETPPNNGIFCFWHRCTLACGWYFRSFHSTILISQSFDGELISRTLNLLGHHSARGSSSRGGAAGLLTLARVIESGAPVVFTADGPRGPIYQTKIGPVKLSQMTREPMGSFYLLAEHAWVMKSWDQFMIPKPFSRVAVSWSRKVAPPAIDATPEELEVKRQELNDAIERARHNAEAHFRK